MQKRYLFLIISLFLISCGGNSINSFYNEHKNENNVTAVRVPQFMLAMLSGLSPEMNSLLANVNDIRYIRIPVETPYKSQLINNKMNSVINSSFVEVFRKNENLKRNIVSVREKKTTVKEIIVFNNDNNNSSVLYFNGSFDPVKVREMAKNNDFESFANSLSRQFISKSQRVSIE